MIALCCDSMVFAVIIHLSQAFFRDLDVKKFAKPVSRHIVSLV